MMMMMMMMMMVVMAMAMMMMHIVELQNNIFFFLHVAESISIQIKYSIRFSDVKCSSSYYFVNYSRVDSQFYQRIV